MVNSTPSPLDGMVVGGDDHPLLRRQRATAATLARFRGRGGNWQKGRTCVHLARFHLVALGHRVEALPRLRSLVAARRALAERGWADVAAMLDAQAGLARIAPAMMLMGDLAVAPTGDGLGGILICAGPHKLFGYREDFSDLVMLDVGLDQLCGAWRV